MDNDYTPLDHMSDAINKGFGNAVGAIIEKAKLHGLPGSGTYTATQTGARQRALYKLSHKGLVGGQEF